MSEARPDLALRRLDLGVAHEVAGFLALYREAIPLRERKPDAQVLRDLHRPDHVAHVVVEAGAVVGLLILYVGADVCVLEYMATAAQVRGGGLGGELYRQARTDADPRPLLIEVESDDEACPDQALRRRRLGFYRRLGARVVEGLDYLLPLPGEGPPPRLKLLIDNWAEPDVVRPELVSWLRETYRGVYDVDAADSRIDAMGRTLPERVRLD